MTPSWRQRGRNVKVASKERRTYNGIIYHSRSEMVRAEELDLLQRAGEITHWERQKVVSMPMWDYRADFVVWAKHPKTGKPIAWYEDIKGWEGGDGVKKLRRYWPNYGPRPMVLRFRMRNKWYKVEQLPAADGQQLPEGVV